MKDIVTAFIQWALPPPPQKKKKKKKIFLI